MTVSNLDPISFDLEAGEPEAFAGLLGASFARHGFAVLSGHGLDEGRLQSALADVRAIFDLPDEEKRRFLIPEGRGQRGYTPFGVETAKGSVHADLKEFWHVGREAAADPAVAPNVWPDEPATFKANMLWLYDALESVGARTLRAIARHLSLPAGAFDASIQGGDSVLRLLRYPPAAFDGPHIRAGAHEDINAITLLLGADEAGLEILSQSGEWLAINPPPGALVVNIGDMLARLTNDVLPSTTHRVVNPAPERRGVARYSTPFFLHFRRDFLVETLPVCLSPDRPNRYPEPITAGAFLDRRLAEIGLG